MARAHAVGSPAVSKASVIFGASPEPAILLMDSVFYERRRLSWFCDKPLRRFLGALELAPASGTTADGVQSCCPRDG